MDKQGFYKRHGNLPISVLGAEKNSKKHPRQPGRAATYRYGNRACPCSYPLHGLGSDGNPGRDGISSTDTRHRGPGLGVYYSRLVPSGTSHWIDSLSIFFSLSRDNL